MTPEVRDVLRTVRDEYLTDESKWFGGNVSFAFDRRCLGYAIGDASARTGEAVAARKALGFTDVVQMIDWNDHHLRTFADVRALLDKALAEETT